MFRPNAFEPVKNAPSYEDVSQYGNDKGFSSYDDENDTTNLERFYHYETSEDQEDETTEKYEENCCPEVNRQLIIYKLFYFIFFGAVGALFPYLAVFYKQLWLSPHQVGILIGLRPFIQMCASPIWGVLADTYNVSKWILLISIGAWLASNYSISFVRPEKFDSSCNLSLTYLPLTTDVDEQDLSWVRIEPIVSKKYNISHNGPNDVVKHGYGDSKSGQQGLGNEDYASDVDDRYNEDQFFRYDDNADDDDFNSEERSIMRDGEKSQPVMLYTAGERPRNTAGERPNNETSRNLKGENKEARKGNETKVFNETGDKMIKRRYEKNVTVMKILERMFKETDVADKGKIKSMAEMQNSRQPNSKRSNDEILKRSSERAKKSKINWVVLHKSLLTKGRALSRGLKKGRRGLKGRSSFEMKEKKRSIQRKLRANERITDEQEESDKYLEDVLNDSRKGEFYAESILPHQRVLAKEGLKEEFDSLRSTEGVFWPILNKADPSNSTEAGNLQRSHATSKIFNILLAITIFGTVLSSPAATLSDTATLQALGDDKYRYGQQRLWGAIGWGLGAFIVGAVVSVTQEMEPCTDPKKIDYILSFYVYAVAMGFAFVCAIFFRFSPVSDTSYRESFWEAIKLFLDCQHLCFILTLLCAGASMGFTHTFLFWHLHDIGGSQFLFSIVAAVQCISEVIMYFLSGYLILKIGCDSVLYIGLLANVMRLFTYSIITQPYFSVPLEILQGISSASIWTAAVCYVGLNDGVQVTLQAMLHGIYWGLGHGGGGILGGISVSSLGSNATFIIFGICCIINLAILLILKYWKKLFELLSGYISVETIPSGTYILVENRPSFRN